MVFLLLFLFIKLHAPAQTIDSCTSNKVVYQSDVVKYFSKQSLDLKQYDWSDQNLNCHLNMAMQKHRQGTGFMIAGITFTATGALVGGFGILFASVAEDDAEKNFATATIVAGTCVFAGGIGFLVAGGSAKEQGHYHQSQVDAYFRK